MKRVLLALIAAGVLFLLAAAPALGGRAYHPEPVEFDVAAAVPSGARASAGFVSRPLRAPKRFNLVGLRWRGSAEPRIAVRVRAAGKGWSRWTRVDAQGDDAPDPGTGERHARGTSRPVWAGEADFLQYRLSRRPPGLRLHFINTTGTATPADRLRTAVRERASRAVAAIRGFASRLPGRPGILSRSAWGGESCPPRAAPAYGEVKAAFVHHTVTATAYTRAQVPAMILGICRYHRNSNGWSDIGYNFLVDRYGRIWEGRAGGVAAAVIGAQAQGFNAQTTGVANLGNFSSRPQTRRALRAMARLIRWKLPHHGQPTAGSVTVISAGGATNRYRPGTPVRLRRVSGHRDGNYTSCPGWGLYRQLPALRRRVGNVRP